MGWQGHRQTNFACNSIGPNFNKPRKRCNSNDANSIFEQAAGELHAKLTGRQRGRAAAETASRGPLHPLRGATPDQKGCTAYRSGAAQPVTRTNAESARRRPGCGARVGSGTSAGTACNSKTRVTQRRRPIRISTMSEGNCMRNYYGPGGGGAWPVFETTHRATHQHTGHH